MRARTPLIHIERRDGVVVAQLTEKTYSGLDEDLLSDTQQDLLRLVEQERVPVIALDMSRTEYFGSTFIEILFRVWSRASKAGGQLALCCLQPFCEEVLMTARLDDLWPTFRTVGDAVHSLSKTFLSPDGARE